MKKKKKKSEKVRKYLKAFYRRWFLLAVDPNPMQNQENFKGWILILKKSSESAALEFHLKG